MQHGISSFVSISHGEGFHGLLLTAIPYQHYHRERLPGSDQPNALPMQRRWGECTVRPEVGLPRQQRRFPDRLFRLASPPTQLRGFPGLR
jgi:hypothetical protein